MAAPDGAKVIPKTKGFVWVPQRHHAPSTNLIGIRVTDDGLPRLSNSTSFRIVVNDFVELTAGAVALNAGESGSVPLDMVSSAALNQFECALRYPKARLANLWLERLAPQLATASLVVTNDDCIILRFAAIQDQSLQGTQRLARLHFTAVAGQASSFIPLEIQDVSCPPAATGRPPSTLMNDGEVTVIGDAPLLRATRDSNGQLQALLFGKPGATYWLEAAASPHDSAAWAPIHRITLSGPSEVLSQLGSEADARFYRVRTE